ncbi:hypothetical protein UlMin_035863 [Ulmus minor]
MEDNHEDQDQSSEQPSQKTPFSRDSDLVIAIALQQQERAFTPLETIESDTDVENDDYTSEDLEYFTEAQGFGAELGFLEDDSEDVEEDDDEDMEEDDVDVDELSYEELVALGEFIGVEERGLPVDEISKCLRPYEFACKFEEKKSCGIGIDRCVICQVEFEDGEEAVSVVPCEHPFHSECISKWLQIKKCCPICSSEVSSSIV